MSQPDKDKTLQELKDELASLNMRRTNLHTLIELTKNNIHQKQLENNSPEAKEKRDTLEEIFKLKIDIERQEKRYKDLLKISNSL